MRSVDPENLLTIDAVMVHFRSTVDDNEEEIAPAELARSFMEPQLSSSVPADVRELFETARGALCYGCFFYPLYTLGIEQLWRVLEAATDHKCREIGAPKRQSKKFGQRIRWLVNVGIISKEDERRWDAARQLRNGASHANRQTIFDPSTALGLTRSIAQQINSLFPEMNELPSASSDRARCK